ncbi:MAG: alkaline phosphatase family protein [Solirubrobacteraceae bacterium]
MLGLALAGCGTAASGGPITEPAPAVAPQPDAKVAIVVLENRSPAAVLERGWLARAARRGGRAANAYGETHPSLGNYLAMLSGRTQGVSDDDVGHGPFAAPTVVRQLVRRKVAWRAYFNAMPSPCFGRAGDTDVTGRYARRHNPFLFFTDVTRHPALCRSHVVPGDRLAADLGRGLPRFVWITPDLCQDMHDCSVARGQRWMARTLPPVIRALGPRGVLFVTADEGTDDAHGGGSIPLVALGGGVRPGSVVRRAVDHRALLATVEDLLGLGRLPATRGAPALRGLLRG